MRLMAMILAAFAGQATAPTQPAALQPSGPWSMEYADSSCILSRPYGDKADQVQFGIAVQPATSVADIVLIFGQPIDLNPSGNASVTIEGSSPSATSTFTSGLTKNGQNRVVKMTLQNLDISSIFVTPAVRIELQGQTARRIAVRGTKEVQAALTRCTDDLLKKWGLDPQVQGQVVIPAKSLAEEATWISTNDYPSLALANDHEGVVKIFWTVGLDGKAHDCKAVQSSGFAELDAAACTAIVNRARYLPAKGADGKPVISYGTRMVRWVIPR